MKTYTKLIGRIALALLVSTSAVCAQDAPEKKSETKQQQVETKETENQGWSTPKKIGVGAAVVVGLGGSAYAVHRYNPQHTKAFVDSIKNAGAFVSQKAVNAKNSIVDKTRSLLGYTAKPRTAMDYAHMYRINALRALGFLPQPETFKQKAMRHAAHAYAKVSPIVHSIKEVSVNIAQNHPYALSTAMAIPTSGSVYIRYTKSDEDTNTDVENTASKGKQEVESAQPKISIVSGISSTGSFDTRRTVTAKKTLTPKTYAKSISPYCSGGSCSIRKNLPVVKTPVNQSKNRYPKSIHRWIQYTG